MSILDKVYETFSNLDRDYARSSKSRTEFIIDKFGGDISTGSIIILDAIREEGVEETPENISTMSFVKDVFNRIKDCADRLDTLQSFDFVQSDTLRNFIDIIRTGAYHGSNQLPVTQNQLWTGSAKSLHFVCTPEGSKFADLDGCRVFRVYNENILGLLGGVFKFSSEPELTDIFKALPGGRLKKIQEGAVARNLR